MLFAGNCVFFVKLTAKCNESISSATVCLIHCSYAVNRRTLKIKLQQYKSQLQETTINSEYDFQITGQCSFLRDKYILIILISTIHN